MEKVLTIIVPSYNTQDYVERCIPTMLSHPYKDKLELLLVNDGSSDTTLERLQWFERRYPQTIRVLDKENGGHGSVINVGIQKARGKYLKVVDGDDWVVSKNLARMICQLEQCNADMVIHPYIRWNIEKKRGTTVRFHGWKNHVMLFEQAAPRLNGAEIQAITYRTKILRENGIRVREKCFYEDTEYDIYPIRYVKTVCIYKDPVCVYCTGIQTQSVNPAQTLKNRRMHRLIVKDCMEYYKQNAEQLSFEKRRYVSRVILKRIRSHYMIYLKSRITARQLQEMRHWDQELKRESVYFYHLSQKFPISIMRLDIRRTYPYVKRMYQFYEKLQHCFIGRRWEQ